MGNTAETPVVRALGEHILRIEGDNYDDRSHLRPALALLVAATPIAFAAACPHCGQRRFAHGIRTVFDRSNGLSERIRVNGLWQNALGERAIPQWPVE
jgi:hypothetical protein